VDTLHTQAADTLAALAEARIGPGVPSADKQLSLTEAHTVPALVLAAGRLAGLGPLLLPERFARHPQLAR
jgi:hypothetical protein